ncbi:MULTISPECIES: cell division protein FtsL [unclassified Roseivivax]|uniref:cell division protein FtsL n=1 Tax=Roseivivax sp. GX 12232 TaxID=2900547 RepID=UPI001E5DAA5F|nr:cell division protein FtsL [Roseivivax sp. GX 12232]MCE0503850.1 cell division protein FtsL [Roseivivax sp. GX 12232]
MRTFLYILTFLSVIGLAFWAYRENYKTQEALTEVQDLRRDIGGARERLAVLKAEWAYLNRPDRLRDLSEVNFERLRLLQFRPDQFGRVDQIAYPAPPILDLSTPIELSSDGDDRP